MIDETPCRRASPSPRPAHPAAITLLLAGLFGLAGCAGSEPGEAPVPVSLALDPGQAISATVMETRSTPHRVVTGLATGDLSALSGATLYVRVEDPAALFAAATAEAREDGSFALTLDGRPLPVPGRLTGTLRIHVSIDAAGRRPLGGSPLEVPYDVTVLDAVALDVASLRVEAPFGDQPLTRSVAATVSPWVTGWTASLDATQGCRSTGARLDPAAPVQRVTCASDGAIGLTFLPAAPGTQAETLEVVASVSWGGETFEVTDRVEITRVVTANDAIDHAFYPAALELKRYAWDATQQEAWYGVALNSGATLAWHGVEYLTHPQAADGHPMVADWWRPGLPTGTVTCDGSGPAGCLPTGIYTARVHYLLTRNGATSDVYLPITLEIAESVFGPVKVGFYWDYAEGSGTNRIQVLAASGTSATLRTDMATTPTVYLLDDFDLVGPGAYLAASRTCTKSSGTCATNSYTPPAVILPADLTTGATETTVSTQSQGGTATRASTVDGVESVTVPAGTFNAVKVTTHITSSGYDGYNVIWWAPGIGRVKIVNYATATPTLTRTWSLKAYGDAAVP